jgi:hypothetical protein
MAPARFWAGPKLNANNDLRDEEIGEEGSATLFELDPSEGGTGQGHPRVFADARLRVRGSTLERAASGSRMTPTFTKRTLALAPFYDVLLPCNAVLLDGVTPVYFTVLFSGSISNFPS